MSLAALPLAAGAMLLAVAAAPTAAAVTCAEIVRKVGCSAAMQMHVVDLSRRGSLLDGNLSARHEPSQAQR